jgi:hypothetical protein
VSREQQLLEALETLTTAVDWEAIYIANESNDDEVKRRAEILLRCNRETKAVLAGMLAPQPDPTTAIEQR